MNISGGFDRTLINFNMHIKSVCRHCGAVIVGSALDGLADQEANHLDQCYGSNVGISLVKLKAFRHAS